MKQSIFLAIALFAISCSEPERDPATDILSAPVFGKVEVGMSESEMKLLYPTAQPDGAGGLLFDTVYGDGTTMSISFSFEDGILSSVQADLAPSTQALADTIKARMGRTLTRQYGAPSQEGDFLSWQTPTGLTDVADESAIFERPHVSFTLYRFDQ